RRRLREPLRQRVRRHDSRFRTAPGRRGGDQRPAAGRILRRPGGRAGVRARDGRRHAPARHRAGPCAGGRGGPLRTAGGFRGGRAGTAGAAAFRRRSAPMSAPVTLPQLLAGLSPVPPAHAGLAVDGLGLDRRQVRPGTGLLAVAGARGHGLDHVQQALQRGAGCVLYEPTATPPALPVPAIAVPDLRAHLGTLAERVYAAPSRALRVVGVTGTNGKTSTVHLLAQALAGAGLDVATIGTLGAGRPGALQE